ncbi:MAG: hypothetical protein ACKV2T_03080 [Kofleriaceae bacterium]
MTDPYRSAPRRVCPSCHETLVANGSTFLCDRGCGEWAMDPLRVVLGAEAVGAVLSFEGFRDPSAKCPDCQIELDGRIWDDAVFRICRKHGVWLEGWARTRFHETIATQAEKLQRVATVVDDIDVRELAERLADPTARFEIARRLIALERRLAELEKKE